MTSAYKSVTLLFLFYQEVITSHTHMCRIIENKKNQSFPIAVLWEAMCLNILSVTIKIHVETRADSHTAFCARNIGRQG